MKPAVKMLDLVVGIDSHIVLLPSPTGCVPTPLPHPFTGLLCDREGLAGMFGGGVLINGKPCAHAGTEGVGHPAHVPVAGTFLRKPTNEAQLMMGSSTVFVGSEPLGYAGLLVLTCQDIGLPPPPRSKGKATSKSVVLPTSIVISIPSGPPVLVGGAPVIGASAVLEPVLPKPQHKLESRGRRKTAARVGTRGRRASAK